MSQKYNFLLTYWIYIEHFLVLTRTPSHVTSTGRIFYLCVNFVTPLVVLCLGGWKQIHGREGALSSIFTAVSCDRSHSTPRLQKKALLLRIYKTSWRQCAVKLKEVVSQGFLCLLIFFFLELPKKMESLQLCHSVMEEKSLCRVHINLIQNKPPEFTYSQKYQFY